MTINVALISACISAMAVIITGGISYMALTKTKNIDYKHSYYEKILQKRIEAYEFIEQMIFVFSWTTVTSDQKPYYPSIATQEQILEREKTMLQIAAYSIWISPEMNQLLEKLNIMLYKLENIKDAELIRIIVKKYNDFGEIKTRMKNQLNKDMLNLYDIESFLKNKKTEKLTQRLVDLSSYH
jgi:hypothetical protein